MSTDQFSLRSASEMVRKEQPNQERVPQKEVVLGRSFLEWRILHPIEKCCLACAGQAQHFPVGQPLLRHEQVPGKALLLQFPKKLLDTAPVQSRAAWLEWHQALQKLITVAGSFQQPTQNERSQFHLFLLGRTVEISLDGISLK